MTAFSAHLTCNLPLLIMHELENNLGILP